MSELFYFSIGLGLGTSITSFWYQWKINLALEANRGIGDKTMSYRDPTRADLQTPEFEVVWQAIKRWDINVPDQYEGYCGATGNHVMTILDALRDAKILTPLATFTDDKI